MNKTKISILVVSLLALAFVGWKIYSVMSVDKTIEPVSKKKPSIGTIAKKMLPFGRENGSPLDCLTDAEMNAYPGYKKSIGKIYFDNFVIEGADYDSFEKLDAGIGGEFARDKNFVYLFGDPLQDVDPSTFKDFDNSLIGDKNGIYYFGEMVVPKAELPEQITDSGIVKCQDALESSAWHIKKGEKRTEWVSSNSDFAFTVDKLKGIDPATFQTASNEEFADNYIKDKNGVYLFQHFNSNSDNLSESDKARIYKLNNSYSLIKIEGVDPGSFSRINDFYIKDKNHVFGVYHGIGSFNPGVNDPEFRIIPDSEPIDYGKRLYKDSLDFMEDDSQNDASIIYFYGSTCPHCKDVENYLSGNGVRQKISFSEREVYGNTSNAKLMTEKQNSCGVKDGYVGAVPFLWTKDRCYTGKDEVIQFFAGRINSAQDSL